MKKIDKCEEYKRALVALLDALHRPMGEWDVMEIGQAMGHAEYLLEECGEGFEKTRA